MRKLILLAVLPMACVVTPTLAHTTHPTDSTKIVHAIDGDISEWRSDRFETDPETKVQYAVDHDQDYLYMAMKIADPAMQMRVSMAGMKMFIDTRGKKKEGTGVEFPVRKESGFPGGRGGQGGGSGSGETPDAALVHQRMSVNMILLKTFGFDDLEDKAHFISEEGTVNIAFNWDADNNMNLEYKVPLTYVGGQSSLKNKTLSIGWKINEGGGRGGAEERPANSSTSATSSSRGGRSGGRGGGGGGGSMPSMGGGQPAEADPKGQFVWTKHVMNF